MKNITFGEIEKMLFGGAKMQVSEEQLAGHSAIIDPWGEILAEAGENEEILQGNLRLPIQAQIKETMDIFGDRRPELYKKTPN